MRHHYLIYDDGGGGGGGDDDGGGGGDGGDGNHCSFYLRWFFYCLFLQNNIQNVVIRCHLF